MLPGFVVPTLVGPGLPSRRQSVIVLVEHVLSFIAEEEPERINTNGCAERKIHRRNNRRDNRPCPRPLLFLEQTIARNKTWYRHRGIYRGDEQPDKDEEDYRRSGWVSHHGADEYGREEDQKKRHQEEENGAIANVRPGQIFIMLFGGQATLLTNLDYRSIAIATAFPPPRHNATTPRWALRRFNS